MPKQLVRSLWFASALLLPCACAFGDDPPVLGQSDLKKPAAVSQWLKENGAIADKARAKAMFGAGVKAKEQKRFGPAAKAFGESAIYYPTPEAIREFADAELLTLGGIRERNKDRKWQKKSYLSSALSLYQSALAADSVLRTLSAEEKRRVQNGAAAFLLVSSN